MMADNKTPADVQSKALQAIELARQSGNVRKGTNETTKAIERGTAKLVVVAEDVEPKEIIMHLAPLCQEKRIPIVFVASKKDLGKASGLGVPCAAIAIAAAGNGEALLKEILSKTASDKAADLKESKAKEAKEEKPKEAKPKKAAPKKKREEAIVAETA